MRGQARKIHCHLCSIISRALLLAIFALAPRTAPAVLALFTVGDVYASLCKRGAYAPFSAKRRSRTLLWL